MAPKSQLQVIRQYIQNLEKQIRTMESAVEVMIKVCNHRGINYTYLEQCIKWLEETNSTTTFSQLCKDLEEATTVMIDTAKHILGKYFL